MKFINESIYWHGAGRISNCLNRFLQVVLGCAPAIILMIFFCKVKSSNCWMCYQKKIIPYFLIECKYAKQMYLRVLMSLIGTIDKL